MNRKHRLACIPVLAGLVLANPIDARERLPDPTRPLGFRAAAPVAAGPQLQLQAILNRQGKREAIVDNQRVRVGDNVQGARVVAISQNGLVYEYQGSQHALHLRPQIRK